MKQETKERLEEHYWFNRPTYKLILYTILGLVSLYFLLESLGVLSLVDMTQVKLFLETYRTEIELYTKPAVLGILVIFFFRRARSWYKQKKFINDY